MSTVITKKGDQKLSELEQLISSKKCWLNAETQVSRRGDRGSSSVLPL